jgi:hypothetical protein
MTSIAASMRLQLKLPPQHQGGARFVALARIVALAAPDLAETGPGVEAARCRVVLLDLEKDGVHAETGEAAQMQVEQRTPHAAPAPGRRNGNREYLRLAGGEARQDESVMPAAPDAGASAAPPAIK